MKPTQQNKVINIKFASEPYTLISRESIYGNPFVIGVHGDRAEVIAQYKEYFYNKIKTDKFFKLMIENLKGKTLACYCKPLACHGDVIKDYLDNV